MTDITTSQEDREAAAPLAEADALRAYFDAHMEMHAAIDSDKFGRAYVKANKARDRLIQIERQQKEQADA
jgi:hypothetical protein